MEQSQRMQERASNAKKVEDEEWIMQMNTNIMTPKSRNTFQGRKLLFCKR